MARKRRKKQTQNQKEFARQRKRLLQTKRRAEKKGYIFPENAIPDKPKRVTKKALERIKNIKGSDLYENALFLDRDTGVVIPAKEQRAKERSESAKKAVETRKRKKNDFPTFDVLDAIRSRIEDMERKAPPPLDLSHNRSMLLNVLDDNITFSESTNSLNEYVEFLTTKESEISEYLHIIEWDSDTKVLIPQSISHLANLLNKGSSLTLDQSIELAAQWDFYDEDEEL